MVQLNDDLIKLLDRRAARAGVSRSQVIAKPSRRFWRPIALRQLTVKLSKAIRECRKAANTTSTTGAIWPR
jgi:hypothetical protein